MNKKIINFKKTVLGWYNFSEILFKYNIDPETFRRLTGVSEEATMGTCEVSEDGFNELMKHSRYAGLVAGWEMVPSDDDAEVVS